MAFGSVFGSNYLFGRIVVATPGTPVSLSQNFPTTIPGIGTVQMNAAQIMFIAPHSNTGVTYVVARGGSKSNVNSIYKDLVPGESFVLGNAIGNSMFKPFDFQIDADVASEGVTCWAVVGT